MKTCLRVVGAALCGVVAVVAFAADDAVRLVRRLRPARDLGHVGAVRTFSPDDAGVRTVKLPRGGGR